MHLPGLFLLWLIPFVHADKDILVEEPRSGGRLWYWSVFKRSSQGAGWSHPSSQSQRYSVCDVDIDNEPNNWLRTEFIDVKNAKRLDIEVTYRFVNCPKDAKPYCKTNFTIYAYHTDKKDPAPDPLDGIFQKELFISPETLPPVGDGLLVTSRGSVVTKAKGIYLAFLDQGACLTINKVVISYRYCPERGKFPRTVAPINNVNLTKQVGECTEVDSDSKGKLHCVLGVCFSSGEWNITDNSTCLCKAGYELVNGSVGLFECKECPSGTYKNTISNTNCVPCPPDSTSTANRTECTCNKGFYDSANMADCKALPPAPVEANTTIVEATYVVISWRPSPNVNGTLRYAVDCFKCNSSKDKNCMEECDKQVGYSPRKENITGGSVTVKGLPLSHSFLFRVYSVSELNQKQKDRDKWNYAEVFVETKALPRAPHKADITTVGATYVVISWYRSPDDNGTLTYAVDCFRCKSGKDKSCKEPCVRQVRYSPSKENITGVNVTVNGLSPSSFFLFRVYSVNELNQLEQSRDKWNYAELFAETKASTPTGPGKPEETSATTVFGTQEKAFPTTISGKQEKASAPTTDMENKDPKAASHMTIIYGLVGLLIVLIVSFVCYIICKRRFHRKTVTQNNEVEDYKDMYNL